MIETAEWEISVSNAHVLEFSTCFRHGFSLSLHYEPTFVSSAESGKVRR